MLRQYRPQEVRVRRQSREAIETVGRLLLPDVGVEVAEVTAEAVKNINYVRKTTSSTHSIHILS
jgi:hypothetical protein